MFEMTQIINKKKYGQCLTSKEIDWLVAAYCSGDVADYQMSALLMAIYFQGMETEELGQLTLAMAASGDQIDFSGIDGLTVDKHSTGGVGDTTSFILVPLVAACGGHVPKMSGRSLGHTGGTIDKLESIPGFQVELAEEDFMNQVNRLGCAIVGQTGNLAPADKKIYALRDVTSTVDAIPLIASSIMSKKIASGADGIVLDVKVGSGAFMKTVDQAKELAQAMIDIGHQAGRRMTATISDMSQPLGLAIGNSLEVQEAIAILNGQGPEDLRELSLTLASQMLVLSHLADDYQQGREKVEQALDNGQALHVFKQMVEAQNGDVTYIDQPSKFDQSERLIKITSAETGTIAQLDALALGELAKTLGAGRQTLDETIDLTAGIVLEKKVGDSVQKGECLAVLHTNKMDMDQDFLTNQFLSAVHIEAEASKPELLHYIYED